MTPGAGPSPADRPTLGDRVAASYRRIATPILRRRALDRVRNRIGAERAKVAALRHPAAAEAGHAGVLAVLEDAAARAAAGEVDAAWTRVHTAREMAILHLEGPALEAAAEELRHEAGKLNAWRKATVLQLLSPQVPLPQAEAASGAALPNQPLQPEKVARAAEVVHEHYQNQAYKDGLRLSQLLRLAIALGLGLVVLLMLAWRGDIDLVIALSRGAQIDQLGKVLGCIAVFGFCGAAVSAAISFQAPQQPSRIPELMSSFQMTLLRLVLGTVSAVIVFLGVRSAAFEQTVALDISGEAYLLLAFAAGFSERLVTGIVETVAGRSSPTAPAKPAP